ncbi:MAG TPA: AAA family ATPase [Solirubrobacteraceae bacterium]|nr:AAA family ATPase [Solirubrobacteraceae bacterium]
MVGRVSSSRFVGRREELAALEAAAEQAHGGIGSVVLVGGEAGMGKSRLIGELGARAVSRGMTVLVGECLALGEGELPYAPVVGALRSLVDQRGAPEIEALFPSGNELAALMPELAGGQAEPAPEPAGSQARLFEQLAALLASAARAAPLVVVVEDFQWADRSTGDFLAFLVRATRREPVALVVSYRSDELDRRHPLRPVVTELERTGRAVRVELRPFTRRELGEQITAILERAPPSALVGELLARSDGNPFFTEELLASAGSAGAPLPASLRDTLLARVDAHSPDVRTLLRVAAAAGRTVGHELLAEVSDMSEDALGDALRDAVDGHLLVHGAPTADYAFRHALMRESVYGDLLPDERRRLHRRLAQAAEAASPPSGLRWMAAAELAHHWYAAGRLEAALPAALAAAAAAEEIYALDEARLHYERALEIWDQVDFRPGEGGPALSRLQVIRKAAEAANGTGQSERAIALARDAVAAIDERAQAAQAALAHERLGRYLWLAGRGDDALPEYRRAVELMPERPPSERALVLAAEGQVLMLYNRLAESNERCAEALAIARALGAERIEAHVLNTLGPLRSAAGDFAGAVEAATKGLEIARRLGLREEICRSYTNGSDALHQSGQVQESIAMALDGIRWAHDFGFDRQWGAFLSAEVAGRLMQVGRWREAEERLREIVDYRPRGVTAGIAYTHLGHLLALRGEFDTAADALDEADEHVRRSSASMWLAPAGAARATLELGAGRPGEARRIVRACLARVADGEFLFFTAALYELGVRACAELAGAAPASAVAERREAGEITARMQRLIDAPAAAVPPLVSASRAACAAESSRIGGAGDPALWSEARRQWELCGDVHATHYAAWREAEALMAAGGDRGAAAALVREAHATAVSLGARPLREGLEGLARRARIELTRDDDGVALGSGLAELELTPREIEVLALLADGMTNREIAAELFISAKTASVHVSRILSKLSVPTRAAAAAAAERLGVPRASGRR